MPPVKKISDELNLIETKNFPEYGKFSFEKFNQVQSSVFKIHNLDCNLVLAAATSVGKTCCAEQFISFETKVRKNKCIYLAPMRALAKEKYDDWTSPNNHFFDLKVAIVTGDFRLSPSRKKELEEADIIIMTPEMLASRCRNYKSENNEFLNRVKTLVVDEFHLITTDNRGDHLEVALMKFCKISSDARMVLMSATMPNVGEIADWVSYQLTGRETYLLESKYRPCPLGIHYESYDSQSKYEDNEKEKVNSAMSIIEDHKDDKFIVFAHTKRTGELMKQTLKDAGYKCDFHFSDLSSDQRHKLEKDFKTSDLQILVATTTLAWGINSPARRVIILGVHRGINEVESYDILQSVGRAGRPGFDPRGDAYILLPKDQEQKYIKKITNQSSIRSRLLDATLHNGQNHYKNLAFHLVSEIHHGAIKNRDDIIEWYNKSLASFQAHSLDDDAIDLTIELLINCGIIKIDPDLDEYKVTSIGMISSMFYFNPFDVADLRRNFKMLFSSGGEDNDLAASICMANIDSLSDNFISKAEKEVLDGYAKNIRKMFKDSKITDGAIKAGYSYYCLMNGVDPGPLLAYSKTLQMDYNRVTQVLLAIDGMSAKWDKKEWIELLSLRVAYGARKELVYLCQIDEIGKVRAEKLYALGIKTPQDVINNIGKLSILNLKQDKMQKIIESANNIVTSNK